MASQTLSRVRLRRPFRQAQGRPRIRLVIQRAQRQVWPLFRRHHYLSGNLHRSAQCYIGTIDNRPAVFTAVLPFPHPLRSGWREHRTVCLPDFQGIGIGAAMSRIYCKPICRNGKALFQHQQPPGGDPSPLVITLMEDARRPGLVGRAGRTARERPE